MFVHRICGLLSAALIVLATVVPATATAHPAHARSHHPAHHHAHRPVHRGIPQHGGGDGDSDNFGAPSDGDGNV